MIRRPRVALLAAVIVLAATLVGTSCTAPPPTLNGTLTDLLTGANLNHVSVTAYSDASETVVASTVSGSDGTYSFPASLLPAGTYRIRYSDADWWHGASSWSDATSVVLTSTTTTLDVGLVPAHGTISGAVTDGANPPTTTLQYTSITAYAAEDGRAVATTHPTSAGDYTFSLPTGSYVVGFGYTDRAPLFNGGAPLASLAPLLTVTTTTPLFGVDATLEPASSITGVVTDGRTPLPNVQVTAIDVAADQVVGTAMTSSGRFTLSGLSHTAYRLQVDDPSGRFRAAPWGSSQADPAGSTNFTPDVGAALDVGSQQLIGHDCDPAVFVTGADHGSKAFAGSNLTNCDLHEQGFAAADLHGAILTNADLAGSDLSGANLVSAQLSGVDATLDLLRAGGPPGRFGRRDQPRRC